MKLELVLLTILVGLITQRQVEAADRLDCYQYRNETGDQFTYKDTTNDIISQFPEGPEACKVYGIWIFFDWSYLSGEVNAFHGNGDLYYPRDRFIVKSILRVTKPSDKEGLLLFDDELFTMSTSNYFSKETKDQHIYFRSAIVFGSSDWTVESKCTRANCIKNDQTCFSAHPSGKVSFVKSAPSTGETVSITPGKCLGKRIDGKTRIPECLCNLNGVVDDANKCDGINGICNCLANNTKHDCDWCISTHGLLKDGTCKELGVCQCDPRGVNNFDYSCNPPNGNGRCNCHYLSRGDKCDKCDSNTFFKRNACRYCACPWNKVDGSKKCEDHTGKCNCKPPFAGDMCEKCDKDHITFRRLCLTSVQKGYVDTLQGYCDKNETNKFKVINAIMDLKNKGVLDHVPWVRFKIEYGSVTPAVGACTASKSVGT